MKKNRERAGEGGMASLPQNILQVGDRVLEGKNIYIRQKVYRTIHRFTENKTKNESGGILVGRIVTEFEKENIIIEGFIEAKYTEATPTTLTFTHKTWEHVHAEVEKKHPGMKILGWIHTHPNFGIFLSEYDRFIHDNFFKEPFQIAYVIDPVREEEGFYFWIGEKLERCPGYYIFDNNGVKISAGAGRGPEEDLEEKKSGQSSNLWTYLTMGLGALLVAVMLVSILMMSMRISKLEDAVQNLARNAQTSVVYLDQKITKLEESQQGGQGE